MYPQLLSSYFEYNPRLCEYDAIVASLLMYFSSQLLRIIKVCGSICLRGVIMKERENNNQIVNINDIKDSVLESFKKIKEARNQIGWTIAELSQRAGVSVGVISELENEKKKDKKIPSLVNFIAIARALRLPKEYVLSLILDYKSNFTKRNANQILESILREYGIHDQESLDFIIQTIIFVKNRKKNKNI